MNDTICNICVGPYLKTCYGSVTSLVTHIYIHGHLVYLNESVWARYLTYVEFSKGHITICGTVRGCRLLIDCVRTLLMTSSCVLAFQEIVFCRFHFHGLTSANRRCKTRRFVLIHKRVLYWI